MMALRFPALLLAVTFALPASAADRLATIPGNTPPTLQNAKYLGHKDPGDVLEIVVGLKMRDEAGLRDLIARQQDEASTDYHRWITPDEFVERFGPLPSDVQKVTRYLESQGATVWQVTPNRMLIQARGTVGQIEQAFSVTINNYSLRGEEEFSNDGDPMVPAELESIVSAVIGMSSLGKLRSLARGLPAGDLSSSAIGQSAVSYTPLQTATAYNLPNGNNQHRPKTTYSGKDVQIGIATYGTYQASDLSFYLSYYGITRSGSITIIPVGSSTSSVNYETTLDIQEMAGQATGADISVYEIPVNTIANFTTMYAQIATDNIASVVSNSWSACEPDVPSGALSADDSAFMQMAAEGITFLTDSGDNGAYACGTGSPALAVEYPASDPYVTAVGGTSLYLNSTGGYKSEKAWIYSGGGISSVFTRPSWQIGPGVPSGTERVLPDISWDADENTGQYTYYEGVWYYGYGTSYGGPNWAALWALATEALKGKRTGQAAPLLYKLGASSAYHANLHDVTTGNNGAGIGPGYKATKNWDYPTGWGSPNGTSLVNWLKKNP